MQPDRVGLYVCGPTVYAPPHIGNARSAVVFDLVCRILRAQYKQVIYIRNITDVDDKINTAAKQQQTPIHQITDKYTKVYQNNLAALGCLIPDHQPRVTKHIPAIITTITRLLNTGHAYEAEGHVLFDVPGFKDYGKLSHRSYQDMLAGARVEIGDYKKHPADFVLWKPSSEDLPGWDSPWGRGRPGWHIECTAMAEQYLGNTIDIHGGGQDLIFPHHENEIAQGMCAHEGQVYCRYWMHNGFVRINQHKMSKSLGNILLVNDLLAQACGETIRLALLTTHYSQPLEWSDQTLVQANKTLKSWYTRLAALQHVDIDPTDIKPALDTAFLAALNDNINTPQALHLLHQWFKALGKLNQSSTQPKGTVYEKQRQIKARILGAAQLLGVLQQEPESWLNQQKDYKSQQIDLTEQDISALLAEREQARKQRDFAKADAIRKQLADQGIMIDDTPEGTKWHYK